MIVPYLLDHVIEQQALKLLYDYCQDTGESLLDDHRGFESPLDLLDWMVEAGKLADYDISANLDDDHLGQYLTVRNQILIRSNLQGSPRFAFTVGHEVGHCILHRSLFVGSSDASITCHQNNMTSTQHITDTAMRRLEWQANRFAASVLMPFPSVCHFLKKSEKQSSELVLACKMRDHFNVSTESARVRIKEVTEFREKNHDIFNMDEWRMTLEDSLDSAVGWI